MKHSVALLATCLVQTLNETDPSFKERFLERLERAYSDVRNDDHADLELLSWMRELLTEARAIDAKVLGEAAVLARWRLGDGRLLAIATNLGPNPARSVAMTPAYILAETRAGAARDLAAGALLGRATVAWLEPA
jgi:hypothetical protein